MVKKLVRSVVIYLAGILFLLPIIWVFSLSIRSKRDVFSAMFFTKDIHFENYIVTWQTFNFEKLFLNSIIVTGVSVIITLIISSLAAYAFSRIKYRGSNIFFYVILLGIMIPPAAVIIPLFLIMKTFGLYNSHMSLVFSYIA